MSKTKDVNIPITNPVELSLAENKPTPNRITKSKKASKEGEIKSFDYYDDIFNPRQIPISLTALERLGCEMIEWALKDPEAFKISQFFHLRGISKNSITRWKERSDRFREYYNEALGIIGNRREIGGLKKQLDGNLVALSMPMYDSEWKANIEWRKNLDKKDDQKPTTQVVVIERTPDSSLVPIKKEK